jgi:hypothetical protein
MLSLQKLTPALLTPMHLRTLLNEIETKLPKIFAFPFNPKTQLWEFYTSLHCITILSADRLGIIIDILLKPVSESFRLVQAIPLHVPYLNETAPVNVSSNALHFTASVEVETDYYLINTDLSQYVMMTAYDAY